MRSVSVIVLGGLLLTVARIDARLSAEASVSQYPALTASAVDDAIRWGQSGKASPYPLRWKETNPGMDDGGVVGMVYTPFVRVALAAQAAFDAGHSLAQEDLAPDILEPVVYIGFRWYCCLDLDHGASNETWHPRAPFDYGIALPNTPVFRRFQVTRPLWVRRDLSMLKPFGGTPYPDVVLVAGYPLSAVSQPGDFIIYRQTTDLVSGRSGTVMVVGHVSPTHVQSWR